MVSEDLTKIMFELPPDERLELARRLVESVLTPQSLREGLAEGVQRIEDLDSGRVKGLTEAEYRAALE